MATITGYTAQRMKEIEDQAIVDGRVDENGHLILQRFNEAEIDAGNVVGPVGPVGPQGVVVGSINNLNDVDTATQVPEAGDTLVWDGANWIPGINIKVQAIAPLNPDVNDLWIDTSA